MDQSLRLLVGLGNPASSYHQTRHNIGREFIDFLLKETKSAFQQSRQAEIFRLPVFFGLPLESPLIGAKLLCYMNESGPALKKVLDQENLGPQEILVLVDDFMIPFGSLRLRSGGSSGGHNGLQSIIETLGTEQFSRLRFGIGPTPEREDPADFVLRHFSKMEKSKLPDIFKVAVDGLKIIFQNGEARSMDFLNRKHLDP